MTDLIDRQVAIHMVCEKECVRLTPCDGKCKAILALESLPSAEEFNAVINEKNEQIVT